MAERPDAVDVHVGARLKLRRTLLGMSQQRLGEAVGLTFQQVQKYERGANRIGASRLYALAQILDVPVSYFFDDMARAPAAGMAEEAAAFEHPLASNRETLELVRAYYRIANPEVRRRLFELAKTLAELSEEDRSF